MSGEEEVAQLAAAWTTEALDGVLEVLYEDGREITEELAEKLAAKLFDVNARGLRFLYTAQKVQR